MKVSVSLFLTVRCTQGRQGTSREAGRNLGERRNRRLVHSLLTGTAAVRADALYPLVSWRSSGRSRIVATRAFLLELTNVYRAKAVCGHTPCEVPSIQCQTKLFSSVHSAVSESSHETGVIVVFQAERIASTKALKNPPSRAPANGALEKERATHSSVLAWRIPGTAEPGGLPSMLERNPQISLATRWEDWASQGHPENAGRSERPIQVKKQ